MNNAYGDIGEDGTYIPRQWVDICWFGDSRWWDWHRETLKHFAGLKVHCVNRLKDRKDLYRFIRGKQRGLEQRKGYISWNKSSGASAINVATQLGATKIILLGFDMREVDGKANWHEDHPVKVHTPYERFLSVFPHIKIDAEKMGVEILNATPDSALTIFPMVKLEEVVEGRSG